MPIDRRDYAILFRTLLSVIILAVCVFILFDKNVPSDYTKWSFGTIGIVLGYWLK